jgi:CDP-diacylglycerol---serine O-phosphatidyltransferase
MIRHIMDNGPRQEPGQRRKKRRLRSIAVLPTLLTLGNLYFGFAATYCCARELEDMGRRVSATQVRTLNSDFFEARAPSFLSVAVWMIFAAMVCDALDGRVARKTGQASKFGEQLDSLADMVSFGTAPALMMVVLTRRELQQPEYSPFGFGHFGQAALFIAAIYVCCTGLRLARFNVEASLEEASHQGFKGLPSPAAAAAVISLVFLHDHLDIRVSPPWPRTAEFLARILPLCTLGVALLMVSRVQYTHAVSSLLRRRPLGHIVLLLLAIPLVLMYTEFAAALLSWGFVINGAVRDGWRRLWNKPPPGLPPGVADKTVSPPTGESIR